MHGLSNAFYIFLVQLTLIKFHEIGFLICQAEKSEVRLKPLETDLSFTRARSYQELTEIESQLGIHESRILQMNQSKETLNKRFLELTELKHVLKETAVFFDEVCYTLSEVVIKGTMLSEILMNLGLIKRV